MTDEANESRRLKVSHHYRHSPEAVFDAWTDERGMTQWMRPGPGMDCRCDLDVREGGTYTIVMINEDRTIEHTGVYREVERPRRLVFTWSAAHLPTETVVTLTFEAVEDGTRLTLVHEGLPDEGSVEGHTQGWMAILGSLEETLKG